MSKAVAYKPLDITKPSYTLPVQPSETVIEKDKEFFLKATRYNSSDGAVHNVVLYTVPKGQVLFIDHVSIMAYSNDYVAAIEAGYVHITALGTYINGVELASGSSATSNINYPTPLKLLADDVINVLYYQPTAAKNLYAVVIVSGYILSNF